MQDSIHLSLSLGSVYVLALAAGAFHASPAWAEQRRAEDAATLRLGVQAQTQAAGTPNELGIGTFVPLRVSGNSVWFVDALANINLADIDNYSSLINTKVWGSTISTSTRLGYRWLNANRSWMFGVSTGYDSRPLATGQADTGIRVSDSQTVFFQQVAAGLEAVSDSWSFDAYVLVPIGTTEYTLNSAYNGGALDTYGLTVGTNVTPGLKASLGYYYQNGNLDSADGSGVLGRIGYTISDELTLGANLSYDQAFATRLSADLTWRFGRRDGASSRSGQPSAKTPVMQALSRPPSWRDVRVHDGSYGVGIQAKGGNGGNGGAGSVGVGGNGGNGGKP